MSHFNRTAWIIWIAVFTVMGGAAAGMAETPVLMMATTTSTDNTGLLDYLAPHFTGETGIDLKWTAVGTGKALEYGRKCDVDVLLVHAPDAEKKYVEDGYGVNRREVMFNDFIVIGPDMDPAGIRGRKVVDALRTIAAQKAYFMSRGDNSGTNKKEIRLWKATGMTLPDKETWYVQTGQGMLATINIAGERNGYTLTDRGTYIKYAHNMGGDPRLKVLVEGDPSLMNQYSVLAVSPQNCPSAKYDLAMRFSDWIAKAGSQERIRQFKLLGQPLFTPNAK